MWFRRDLRLGDNPALAAAASGGEVVALFVVDPVLWKAAGEPRRRYLAASLQALDEATGGNLVVRHGDPVAVVPAVVREAGASSVHVAADFGPYGARRDEAVEQALDVPLERLGSPYAVAPGSVLTGAGQGYQVFTPFYRAWVEHGWRKPAELPAIAWGSLPSEKLPPSDVRAGEQVAVERWHEFLDRVESYQDHRDLPATDGTSRMSVHLKWGEIHPRTLLADLARLRSEGAATYRKELAWREFYADVLRARPETAREYLRPEFARMRYDEPGEQLEAWRAGRTGFPVVDAGLRQLRATGWMHNRVRMIVASFLVKDLHLEWQHGARHFMHWLVDGDLASNQHGWQWTAGCGTEAAPYFRVFNPTAQGRKFDPRGAYVRRWVPELADPAVVPDPHDPRPEERLAAGYPEPLVDHAAERREALDRWEEIR